MYSNYIEGEREKSVQNQPYEYKMWYHVNSRFLLSGSNFHKQTLNITRYEPAIAHSAHTTCHLMLSCCYIFYRFIYFFIPQTKNEGKILFSIGWLNFVFLSRSILIHMQRTPHTTRANFNNVIVLSCFPCFVVVVILFILFFSI